MHYYVELPSGERIKINEGAYEVLTMVYEWFHVIITSDMAIIRKGDVS